jgi:hypothetical protein
MKFARFAAGASMLSLGLLLAACGGGGINSTPTPGAPTPTPTPATPSALPGGSQEYKNEVIGVEYDGNPATGEVLPHTDVSGGVRFISFSYDAQTKSYLLASIIPTHSSPIELIRTGPTTDPAISDSKFFGYSVVDADGTRTLRLYRYGPDNPELRLTYSSFGHWTWRTPPGHLNFRDAWFAYGIATAADQLPTTGSAKYTGVLYGLAVNTDAGKQFDLEGTSKISLDFASKMASGEFDIVAVAKNGSRIDAGTARFADALIYQAEGYQFDSDLTGPQVGKGVVSGSLFGPNAAEVGGTFAASLKIDSATFDYYAQGAFAAKHD